MSLDLSDVATELLGELGSSTNITLIRDIGGTTDRATGDYTPGTEESIPVTGVVKYLESKANGKGRATGASIEITIDNAVEPLKTDLIEVSSIRYTVVPPIIAVNPSGVVQVYKVKGKV